MWVFGVWACVCLWGGGACVCMGRKEPPVTTALLTQKLLWVIRTADVFDHVKKSSDCYCYTGNQHKVGLLLSFALEIVKRKPQQLFVLLWLRQNLPFHGERRRSIVSRRSGKITQTHYPCGQNLVPQTRCEPIWCGVYRHRLVRHFLTTVRKVKIDIWNKHSDCNFETWVRELKINNDYY